MSGNIYVGIAFSTDPEQVIMQRTCDSNIGGGRLKGMEEKFVALIRSVFFALPCTIKLGTKAAEAPFGKTVGSAPTSQVRTVP